MKCPNLRTGLPAGLLLLVTILLLPACGRAGPRPPDVVVLVMDTTRADRCSLTGYERPTTPFLDSLAAESVVYDDAWAPSSWTGPSHASLFTGLRPEHHGYLVGTRQYLDSDATTLAEILDDAGYETACITTNSLVSADTGLVQGF
jgi:arylsulfatase A-like enzyme